MVNMSSEQVLVEDCRVKLESACQENNVPQALEALNSLVKVHMCLQLLADTKIGHVLKKVLKAPTLADAHPAAKKLKIKWMQLLPPKPSAEKHPRDSEPQPEPKKKQRFLDAAQPGEPGTVSKAAYTKVADYRSVLVEQRKEMYKDPPALPPLQVELLERKPMMERESDGVLIAADFPEFRPNLSPAQVLQRGSFGGTYFRSIESAVTGVKYGREVLNEYPKSWFKGLSVSKQLCSPNYDKDVNMYRVKCGGSLGMWESSGWISPMDPYGWFQWYCRFYLGRRTTDDARQVQRWLSGHGPKGRFRKQLLNKILAAGGDIDNYKVSPVIRQTCQHWGYVVTQQDLDELEASR